jgi:hypothetical protein
VEFLNPAALYALALLPLAVVPYLMRRRPRRLIFSSVLLLRELAARATTRRWGRLYLPPVFFLQLLFLLLLLLALGEPIFSVRSLNVALVLDNSASMQAIEGDKSRFQMAQEEAAKILHSLPPRARVDLYLSVPRLLPVTKSPVPSAEAIARLSALKTFDLGEPSMDYGAELERLAREKEYERVYFMTDHPAEGQSATVRVISLGRPKGNLALTAFRVGRRRFAAPQLEARAEVLNFSAREENFKLAIKGSGQVLVSRAYSLGPGMKVEASFENLPVHPYYAAEIAVGDGLALDNHRFAVPPPSGGLKILAVSPRPEALASLRSIPGVELQIISPQAYEKGGFEPHALEIFHYSAPAALPDSHALFVLPPNRNPLVGVGPAASRPPVSGWRDHPVTRYINFALFRPAYARPLKPGGLGEAIIQSPDGALAVVSEQKNFRYLALGFDPFPFLGRQNLPVSILTLNLLEWFHENETANAGATGAALYPPLRAGEILLGPDGAKIGLEKNSASFSRTYFQGIYQAMSGESKRFFAVNLDDRVESDLRWPTAIQLREPSEAVARRFFNQSLWFYLLLFSLALLLLEWFINPGAVRRREVKEPAGQSDDFRWA